MLISILIAAMHPCWCYFYMVTLDIGFFWAAYALSTSRTLELALLVLYVAFSTDSELQILQKSKWTWEVMRGWKVYFQLGAPNILMMSEWWASEAIIFMAGYLSNPDVQISSLSVFQNVGAICFMLPRGLETAGCSRVGHALGENNEKGASNAVAVCVMIQLVVSMVQSSALVVCKASHWIFVF